MGRERFRVPAEDNRVVQESCTWQANEPTGNVKTWMPIGCVCVSNEQQSSGSDCGDFRFFPRPYGGESRERIRYTGKTGDQA
jgi:hypothetical protein